MDEGPMSLKLGSKHGLDFCQDQGGWHKEGAGQVWGMACSRVYLM